MALEKAILINESTNEQLRCLFNPTEYGINKTTKYARYTDSARDVSSATFIGGEARSLSLSLLFDVSEQPGASAKTYVDKLFALAMIDPSSRRAGGRRGSPPLCSFVWGNGGSFKGVVTSLKIRYSLFRADGTPIRAHADLVIDEVPDRKAKAPTNPNSYTDAVSAGGTPRRVAQGETLAYIAYTEYGDPNQWRRIARANDIEDPLALRPGRLLLIPRREAR